MYVLYNSNGYIGLDAQNKPTIVSVIGRAKKFKDERKAQNFRDNLGGSCANIAWEVIPIETIEELMVAHNKIPSVKVERMPMSDAYEQILQCVSQLRKLLLASSREKLNKELKEVTDELCDIEHAAEFTRFNAMQGYRIAKMLQDVRKRRRRVKDELFVLDALEMVGIQQDVDNLAIKLNVFNNRKYEPRKLKELFEQKGVNYEIQN